MNVDFSVTRIGSDMFFMPLTELAQGWLFEKYGTVLGLKQRDLDAMLHQLFLASFTYRVKL